MWIYLCRAVDKAAAKVDFLLTAKRDRKAALRFLRKAIGYHGTPKKITIDKSGSNAAAVESYNAEQGTDTEMRQVKYLDKPFFSVGANLIWHGCLDIAFVILREAAIEPEPCESPLNNPCENGNLERSLFAFDDLQVPPVASQLPSELAALVPSISNDGSNGRPERREPRQHSVASSVVRHVGGFDAIGDRKAENVDQDVALPPFHSFVPIESANPTTFGRLHRLAIHDGEGGPRLPICRQAGQRDTARDAAAPRHQPYASSGSTRARSAKAGSRLEAAAIGSQCGADR